jgi:hypothetical protein
MGGATREEVRRHGRLAAPDPQVDGNTMEL